MTGVSPKQHSNTSTVRAGKRGGRNRYRCKPIQFSLFILPTKILSIAKWNSWLILFSRMYDIFSVVHFARNFISNGILPALTLTISFEENLSNFCKFLFFSLFRKRKTHDFSFLLMPSTIFGNKKSEKRKEKIERTIELCACAYACVYAREWEMIDSASHCEFNGTLCLKQRNVCKGKFQQLNGNRINNGQVNTSQRTESPPIVFQIVNIFSVLQT